MATDQSLGFTKHKLPCQLQQLFLRLICWFSKSLPLKIPLFIAYLSTGKPFLSIIPHCMCQDLWTLWKNSII